MKTTADTFQLEYTVGLNDGRRKYGMVIRRDNQLGQFVWQFVPNNHIVDYNKSKNPELVELIPDSMVAFIDCYTY